MSINFNQFGKSQKFGGAVTANPSAAVKTSVPKTSSIDFNQFGKSGIINAVKSTENPNNPSFAYNQDDSLLKSAAKTVGNIPSSIGNVAAGLGNILLHPIDTATGIGKIAVGGVEKLIPGEQGQEKSFDALTDFFKKRYGSVEGFKKTLVEDPAGLALDVSTLFSGGGTAATKLGTLSKANRATKAANVANMAGKTGEALKAAKAVSNIGEANALTKTGEVLSTIGDTVNPITQGTRLFGKGVEAITAGKTLGGKKYDSSNISALENIGVDAAEAPIFAKTTSPIAVTAEAVASKGLGGRQIWERMENIYAKMNDTIDSLLKDKLDKTTLGVNITKAVDDFKNNFFEQKNDLYKEAVIPKSSVAKDIPGYEGIKSVTLSAEDPLFSSWNKKVLSDGQINYTKPSKPLFSGSQAPMMAETTKTQLLLKSLAEREAQALKGFGVETSGELKTYTKLLEGLARKDLTTSDVYRTLQKLNRDIKFGTAQKTGNNAELSLIRETLDSEFMATLQKQRPDLAAKLEKANTFYREGVRKINSGLIQSIIRNANNPDLIVKALLPKLESLEDVKLLVEVLGQKNMEELRKAILDSIFTEAKGAAKENLQPLGISKQLKKFGEDKLEILLDPDQMQAVRDLEQISKMMGKSSKITGGSQTSFNLLSTVGGGSVATALTLLFMGNARGAILSLSPLFGTLVASKIINSNFGRKFLTEGRALTGKTGRSIQSAAPMLGTGAQIGSQLNNLYNSNR